MLRGGEQDRVKSCVGVIPFEATHEQQDGGCRAVPRHDDKGRKG